MTAPPHQACQNRPAPWSSRLALAYLILFLAAAAGADWLPLAFSPNDLDLDHIKQPPFQWHLYGRGQPFHWLGTDQLGRDLLANILFGARTAVLVSLPAMVLAAALGLVAGSLAGYFGDRGWRLPLGQYLAALVAACFFIFYGLVADTGSLLPPHPVYRWLYPGLLLVLAVLLYRLVAKGLLSFRWGQRSLPVPVDLAVLKAIELVQSVPRLLLVLCLASLVPPSRGGVVALCALTYWPGLARLVRGEMIRLKGLPFIEAAVGLGLSHRQIIIRHALPNALGPVIVAFCFGISNLMALESTLSFLGIGIPPDVPSWGRAITGIRLDFSAWWLVFFPGLVLCLTVLAVQAAGAWLVRKMTPTLAG
jgi:peptide/nickel transport system permease protein